MALTNRSRRLVVCLDGTWNSSFSEHMRRNEHGEQVVLKPTNTLKTCRAVLPFADDGPMQICYYDIGVGALAEYPGTANKLLYTFDRLLGGAWAAGFEGNVEDALHFLTVNLQPEDEVFVFGFSRGAAEARAVTQFIDWNRGLPKKNDAYYLPMLFRAYVASHGRENNEAAVAKINQQRASDRLDPLRVEEFQRVDVKYLGIWETVLALGSRLRATGATTTVDNRGFFTGDTPAKCVARARQALGVDEHRWDFRPEIWKGAASPSQTMEQRWFIGVHSNIGGGYGRDGLANIALGWILEGAAKEGLGLNAQFLKPFIGEKRPYGSLYNSSTVGYQILDGLRRRDGHRPLLGLPPTANAELDASVIERMTLDVENLRRGADEQAITTLYRPENVIEFLAAMPDPALQDYLAKIGAPPLPQDVKDTIAALRKNPPKPRQLELDASW
jgi:uncharacterized protein (DUF2235 family)